MNGFFDFVMLVCAVIVALGAGVMLGYVACRSLFGLCSMHVRATRPSPAKAIRA